MHPVHQLELVVRSSHAITGQEIMPVPARPTQPKQPKQDLDGSTPALDLIPVTPRD